MVTLAVYVYFAVSLVGEQWTDREEVSNGLEGEGRNRRDLRLSLQIIFVFIIFVQLNARCSLETNNVIMSWKVPFILWNCSYQATMRPKIS